MTAGRRRDQEDLIYLAALVDGEGSIGVHKHQRYNHSRNPAYGIQLSIEMTKAEKLLSHFCQKFGGSMHSRKRGSYKTQYAWRVTSSDQVAEILMAIYPYMRLKREQAVVAIAYWATLRPSGGGGSAYTKEELEQREKFYLRMKELNE